MNDRFLKHHKLNKLKKMKRWMALFIATVLLAGAFYVPPVSRGRYVYADADADGSSSKEATPAPEGTAEEVEKASADKPFNIQTSRVAFYEWRKVTCDNFRTIFSDNEYHLSMLIPCYYTQVVPKNKLYTDSDGCTSSNGYVPNHMNPNAFAITDWVLEYRGNANFAPYPGNNANQYGMTFFSTYADSNHIFLPTEKNDGHHSEYKDIFRQTPYPTEEGDSPYPYSFYKYYNNAYGARHSPSYWNHLERNLFIDQDASGYGYDQNTKSWYIKSWSEYFGKDRFFTQNDSSYGMPFIKCAQMKSDECKMAVEFVLENEPMNTREVKDFKDNGKNWHLYCGVPDDEPLLYMSKKQVVGQNYLHMVCPWNTNSKLGRLDKGKNKDIWVICAFNNGLDNDDVWCDYGTGCFTDADDYSCLTYLPSYYQYEWLMQSGRKQYGICDYMWYVGTPHVFTAIDTQTVPSGQFYPFKTGNFANGEDKADYSEGVMLPKGRTLTVDGGVVAIECNFINNGKIIVKNGGTLVIKKGGTISPYTAESEGTIECDNGSIIIMEGATVYAIKDSATQTIKLTTGTSLINYGSLFFTCAALDSGSKIENRKDGVLVPGMIRTDDLAFIYGSPPRKSGKTFSSSCTKMISASQYGDLLSVVYASLVRSVERKSANGNMFSNFESVANFASLTPDSQRDDWEYRITYKNGSQENLLVKNAAKKDADNQVFLYLIQNGTVPKSNVGVIGLGGASPNIKVEKTSSFYQNDPNGVSYVPSANIIVPEY